MKTYLFKGCNIHLAGYENINFLYVAGDSLHREEFEVTKEDSLLDSIEQLENDEWGKITDIGYFTFRYTHYTDCPRNPKRIQEFPVTPTNEEIIDFLKGFL